MSSIVIRILKESLKRDFNLTDERCAEYDPSTTKQERVGALFTFTALKESKEQETSSSMKFRFALDEYRKLIETVTLDDETNIDVLKGVYVLI